MTLTQPSSRTSRRTTRVRGESVVTPDPIDDGSGGAAAPFMLGVLAGLQAAVVGLFGVAVPAVVFWMASSAHASVLDALRSSALIWLSAHRTQLSVTTGAVHLAPLGLTLALGGVGWFFARRAGRALAFGGASDGRAGKAQAGFVLAYVIAGVVLALLSPTSTVRPQPETAVPGLLVLSALASAAPLWQHRIVNSWREPASTRRGAWLRAGLSALAFPAALAMLVLAVCVFLGFSRVSSIYDALHPGAAGSIGLALAHLAVLPNAVVWLLSWFAGPGFMVGIGTSVTTSHTVLGPLPALPLLGVLPAPGVHPSWVAGAGMVAVVIGGVLGGRFLVRWHADTAPVTGITKLQDIAAACVVTGLVAALLSWWTSGPLGGGVMAWWGIGSPWFPLIVAAEAGLGLTLAVLGEPVFRRMGRIRRHG